MATPSGVGISNGIPMPIVFFYICYVIFYNFGFKMSMGLSHLDAEVVVWFSSAYKGTPESQNAAKKHT